MTKKLNAQVVNAAIWAATMLATALLVNSAMDDGAKDVSFTIIMIHIAGWLVIDRLIARIEDSKTSEEG